MPWRKWSVLSLIGGWMLLTSCSLLPHKPDEPFVCVLQPAYDCKAMPRTDTNAVNLWECNPDTSAYNVNRACLRGVNERLKACYKE